MTEYKIEKHKEVLDYNKVPANVRQIHLENGMKLPRNWITTKPKNKENTNKRD